MALFVEGRNENAPPFNYKDYGGRAYETSSMGIQFLYADPVGLKECDPKLFAFAIRQLLEGAGK